jgi:thiosulfate/3-mercaptopyruvate sulfurtransferase
VSFRILLLGVALAAPLAAQSPREKLLVSPQWLNEHINDRNLVILHGGPKAGYDTAHIAGARYVDFRTLAAPFTQGATPPMLSLELPDPDTLRARLATLGVSDNSRIVIYPTSVNGISTMTRVILTLDHAGLGDATSLLDGGLAGWTQAGYKTTAEVPAAATGSLSPLKLKNVTVNADFVTANVGKPGFALIDGRAAVFYDGVQEGGPMDAHRKGHIKGAVSVPFTEITDAAGVLKSPADLQALFTRAGVKPGDTIIGYCHIGQQATQMLFGARTLGYKVLLYDGSFEDWARRGLPLEVPPGK